MIPSLLTVLIVALLLYVLVGWATAFVFFVCFFFFAAGVTVSWLLLVRAFADAEFNPKFREAKDKFDAAVRVKKIKLMMERSKR